MSQYPRWFFGAMVIVLVVLLASGVLLIPDMLEMRLGWDVPVAVSGSVRLDSAALHSLAGMLAVGLVGALSAQHVRGGWLRRRNHVSGIVMIAMLAALAVTAVAIYYLGDADWSRRASALHALLGLCVTAAYGWHHLRGRRLRRASAACADPPRRPGRRPGRARTGTGQPSRNSSSAF